jgi:hypothetical protein
VKANFETSFSHLIGSRAVKPGGFKLCVSTGFDAYRPAEVIQADGAAGFPAAAAAAAVADAAAAAAAAVVTIRLVVAVQVEFESKGLENSYFFALYSFKG